MAMITEAKTTVNDECPYIHTVYIVDNQDN